MLTHNLHVNVSADGGVIHRRSFLRHVAVGSAAVAGSLSWMDAVRAEAAQLRRKGLACILLFQRGAPSQFETWDPKPGAPTGGPTQAIKTSVPGIEIAEGWENVARQARHLAFIRSMTSREGNHERAQYFLHTGYVPSGSVKYPGVGSIVASELCDPTFDLPHYVAVGGNARYSASYLGTAFNPFLVNDPNRMPFDVELPPGVDADRLQRRLTLMDKLQNDFARAGGEVRVNEQSALLKSAAQMVLSPRLKAFDLSEEPESIRTRYGQNNFGQGCLLARRLVEGGVTFVEVNQNGWDTHEDNFNRVKRLAGVNDPAFATLLADLHDRGRLDKTLVIWMGEFGRTPVINPRTGRDHYPRCFSVALAGAGIKGGQVIGASDKEGRTVADRPVTVQDLFCTIYRALDIDPRKELHSQEGRPIKLVDGGKPIGELFS
ncbi:MAG TPA: DUF1501 domain-containing protein [Gemmatales bacterium]|nr:DUF1501 domain-containing protein [Gemmatales bacterium]HMP59836.1 DUF1501 domain-containing protein [Gemmatales bacterium]